MNPLYIALSMLAFSLPAWSLGGLANVEILDRDRGETLPVYEYRGEYWVAGTPGSRYAVVVTNRRDDRLLAVMSVDGINVISGESAAWNQTGYVFAGGGNYAINGWRKSNQEVADFNFTALPDSYAARTGRAANVGIIGVAIFRERPPVSRYLPDLSELRGSSQKSDAAAPAAALRAPAAAGAAENALKQPANQAAPTLGTGHGAREVSYAGNTEFERLSDTPDEIIRIRYDRYAALVARGIVRARPAPMAPNAFPDSSGSRFVPDPPGR
jgi:hypothetical protein